VPLSERIDLLVRAAQVIAKFALQTFSVELVMEDYRRLNQERKFSEVIAFPFSLCARFASVQVQQWATPNGITDRVKMVFENRSEGEHEVKAVFGRDELPLPAFEAKSVCTLQAADLIAWLWQAKATNSPNYERVGKMVLAELNKSLHVSDILTYGNMLQIWNHAPCKDETRETMLRGVAFHATPKGTRPTFRK
jgi:hypothetical protein